MRVLLATEKAPDRPCNEDAVFNEGGLIGVLDGVSAPEGTETGCVHGPAWYVDRLTAQIVSGQRRSPVAPLPDLLAEAIDAVRVEHGGRCDLAHPGTPAAAVGLMRADGDQADYLLLCDVTMVFDTDAGVHAMTDERFARAVAAVRRDAFEDAPAIGTADQRERVRQATLRRQLLTNRPDGYWIAAADPAAAHHAVVGNSAGSGIGSVRRAALLTDGAADVVERYRLVDWPGLMAILAGSGPAEVIRRVRVAEIEDPTGQGQPRYKRHDDATVAYCELTEESE